METQVQNNGGKQLHCETLPRALHCVAPGALRELGFPPVAPIPPHVPLSPGQSDSQGGQGGSIPPDMIGDCTEFAQRYSECSGKPLGGGIDRKFISKMVNDELDELAQARDEAEEVDALLDAVYYILHHLANTGLDVRPVWNMIHQANMTKFGPGGYRREDGKWCKPPDFTPPDDLIRAEIQRQRGGGMLSCYIVCDPIA